MDDDDAVGMMAIAAFFASISANFALPSLCICLNCLFILSNSIRCDAAVSPSPGDDDDDIDAILVMLVDLFVCSFVRCLFVSYCSFVIRRC